MAQTKNNYSKNRRRRNKRRNGVYSIITALAIVIAAVAAVNFLFRIETIEVNGSTHYSTQQIVDASGFAEGKCMYLVNKFSAARNIADSLPYVQDVDIYRDLPSTIIIDITERTPSVIVKCGPDYWMLDEQCKVLDKVKTLAEVSSGTNVVGLTVKSAQIGKTVEVEEEEKENLDVLKTALKAFAAQDVVGKFDSINVSEPENVTCSYNNGDITVRFGNCSKMDYRVQFCKAIINDLQDGQTGIIDITNPEKVRFIGA